LLNCGYSAGTIITTMIHNGDDCILYNYDFTTWVGLLEADSLLKQADLELVENYDL